MRIPKISLKSRFALLKGTALVTGIGAAAYVDSATTGGFQIAPKSKIAVSLDSTLQQLYHNPARRESLIILNALTYADTQADLNAIRSNSEYGIKIRYSAAASPTHGPSTKFKNRALLYFMSVEDPAKKDSGQYLDFQMICHHQDPTGLNAFAFYNKANKTVLFIFPGLDVGDKTQRNDFLATLRGERNPQIDSVNSFMEDVKYQIIARGLRVEHATIFSHSLGGGPAIAAKAYCLRDGKLQRLLGGKISTVFLENWGASKAAHDIVNQSSGKLTLSQLTEDCFSVQHAPGTFTSVNDNPPIGYNVALMPVQADHSPWWQLFYREWHHRSKYIISELSDGRTVVVNGIRGEAPRLFDGPVELVVKEYAHGRLFGELGSVAVLVVGGAWLRKKRYSSNKAPGGI